MEIEATHVSEVSQVLEVDHPRDGDQHYGCQHRLREHPEGFRQEDQHQCDGAGGDQQRSGRAGAGLPVDGGLRHAAGHREALSESRREVRGRRREQLALGVDGVPVLEREGPRGRDTFHEGEQETGERQRQQRLHVLELAALDAEGRQAARQLAHHRHPAFGETCERHHQDRGHHHDQHHRPPAQEPFAEGEHAEGGQAEQERGKVDRAELPDQVRNALEEVRARGGDTE